LYTERAKVNTANRSALNCFTAMQSLNQVFDLSQWKKEIREYVIIIMMCHLGHKQSQTCVCTGGLS